MPSRATAAALTLALSLLAGWPPAAMAERAQRFGDYAVHYSAIPTATLQPAIARQYGIDRSRRLGLLNVAVLRDGEPVPATVTALRRNLAQQLEEVSMREVREGNAVYYLGTFQARDQAELTFTLRVSPRGSDAGPFEVQFEQVFFADG